MNKSLLLGLWRATLPLPRPIWQSRVTGVSDLTFMTPDHRRVHHHVYGNISLRSLNGVILPKGPYNAVQGLAAAYSSEMSRGGRLPSLALT